MSVFASLVLATIAQVAAPSPPMDAPAAAPVTQAPIDAATCRTFISGKGLPPTHYTTIKDIKVSKKWYSSTTEMFGALATQARKIKADGVINVRTWHAPAGFSWAAPHAGGMAIKWTETGRAAMPSLEGRCYWPLL